MAKVSSRATRSLRSLVASPWERRCISTRRDSGSHCAEPPNALAVASTSPGEIRASCTMTIVLASYVGGIRSNNTPPVARAAATVNPTTHQ
jgi:hypothetical protein